MGDIALCRLMKGSYSQGRVRYLVVHVTRDEQEKSFSQPV